jgi:hypothetical protein
MRIIRISAFMSCLFFCLPAVANHVTLSAQWDGSEDEMSAYEGSCRGAAEQLAYRQFNPVQVSSDGEYHLADVSDNLPGDVTVAIYEGSFDSEAPQSNLVDKFDQGGRVTLHSGRDYIVVVQHWCTNVYTATFGVSLFGEGDISGADVVTSSDWTRGGLYESNPTAVFGGVSQHYAVSGLQTFPATGLYHFADITLFDRLDTVIRVYEGLFNPLDTEEHLVTSLDDSGGISLKAGINYQFVITSRTEGNTGDWLWVLFPPGSQQLNAGLNGAWFNPATNGQGILVDVMPELQMVSLAWFTFDLQRPDGGSGPMIGDDGQRWLTALGKYETGDNSVVLNIQNSTGGVFDNADPPVGENTDYGTIELQFSDCLNGTMTYDIPAGPVSNVVPITRVVYDHLPLCASLGSLGTGVITN